MFSAVARLSLYIGLTRTRLLDSRPACGTVCTKTEENAETSQRAVALVADIAQILMDEVALVVSSLTERTLASTKRITRIKFLLRICTKQNQQYFLSKISFAKLWTLILKNVCHKNQDRTNAASVLNITGKSYFKFLGRKVFF